MVEVEIRGKAFPLCLTVAALDEINEKCGGMQHIGAFLDGKDSAGAANSSRVMTNTAWMLALLLREGEENRLVYAHLGGEDADRRDVPGLDTLRHYMTFATAKKYRLAVITAINESMVQDIEALYPKNVKDAERG